MSNPSHPSTIERKVTVLSGFLAFGRQKLHHSQSDPSNRYGDKFLHKCKCKFASEQFSDLWSVVFGFKSLLQKYFFPQYFARNFAWTGILAAVSLYQELQLQCQCHFPIIKLQEYLIKMSMSLSYS